MSKYQSDIDGAYNDLKDAGTAMTIKRKGNPVVDDDGNVTYPDSVNAETYGIWDYKVSKEFGLGYIDGSMITSKDKFAVIAAKGISITPASPDELVVGGKAYEIANAKALEPDGTPIMLFLHVRS